MSHTNEKTIAAYDTHVQGYVANTPHEISHTARTWLNSSLEGLVPDARILEIGSGFGHDATYIEQRGYNVERTDATPGFIHLLREEGNKARLLNVLSDKIEGPYDLVVADSVLHHLTRAESITAARNIIGALGAKGRFAAGMRLGLSEGWSSEKLGVPRYFSHWERADIEEVIKKVGFTGITTTDSRKVGSGWLHFIAKKS